VVGGRTPAQPLLPAADERVWPASSGGVQPVGVDPAGRLAVARGHAGVVADWRRPRSRGAGLVQHQFHRAAWPADECLRLERAPASHPADPVDGLSLRHGHGRLAAAAARSDFHHRAERLMLSGYDLALDYRTGGSVAHAVDSVSLAVGQGSFVGLIGPSGSGKSSLMYLLSGLKRPTRGSVTFEGRDYQGI